ncbi:hypothetical protein QO179_21980 [Bacillus stercoris]|nr:hypothetical protein [Bacillus stercoris]
MRIVEKEEAVIKQEKRDFVKALYTEKSIPAGKKKTFSWNVPFSLLFSQYKKADMVTMPA